MLVLALGIGLSTAASDSLSKEDITKIVETTTDQSKIESPLLNVAKSAKESVVGVNNYQTRGFGNFNFDYYGFPLYPAQGGQPTARGTGSGVVVSPYGQRADQPSCDQGRGKAHRLPFGEKELDATLVSSDKDLDLAVLLVPGIDLPAAPLGDSDALQIGEYAIVIGNSAGQPV